MGGMVLETNMTEIMLRIEEQTKLEKEEVLISYSSKQLISSSCFIFNLIWLNLNKMMLKFLFLISKDIVA